MRDDGEAGQDDSKGEIGPSGDPSSATAPKLIKGTMLVDQVRQIRANKHLDWQAYLGPEDWAVIQQRILPSSWYPLAVYEHCGWATFMVLANGDLERVRARGHERGIELFTTTYRALAEMGSVGRALDAFVRGYSLLFNFSSLRFEDQGPGHVRIHHEYASRDRTNGPYCYQLLGHLEALVHVAGGTEIHGSFLGKRWEGDDQTTMDLRWSSTSR